MGERQKAWHHRALSVRVCFGNKKGHHCWWPYEDRKSAYAFAVGFVLAVTFLRL